MAIKVNGEEVKLASVEETEFEIEGSDPQYKLSENDQADPAGRYRFRVSGDQLLFQRATSADWATFVTLLTIDSSGAITRDHTTAGITASTTQSQGQGALTSVLNQISVCANANDVVTLPAAVAGLPCIVINKGAQTLQVFPASGDDLGQGANNSTTIAAGDFAIFQAYDATTWVLFSHIKYTDAEAVTQAKTVKLDDFAAPDDNTDLDASTSKHGLLKKLDNVATNYLDGTGAFSVPSGGGPDNAFLVVNKNFDDPDDFVSEKTATNGDIAEDFGGIEFDTSASQGSRIYVTTYALSATNGALWIGNPDCAQVVDVVTEPTDGHAVWGIGQPIISATAGITFTTKHSGFKLTYASSAAGVLSAKNADGTTESASDISSGIALTAGQLYRVKITDATDAKMYINQVLKATLTNNLPTGNEGGSRIGMSNVNVATQYKIKFGPWRYIRDMSVAY